MTKYRVMYKTKKISGQLAHRSPGKVHHNDKAVSNPMTAIQRALGNHALRKLLSNHTHFNNNGSQYRPKSNARETGHDGRMETSAGIKRDEVASQETTLEAAKLQGLINSLESPGRAMEPEIIEKAQISFGAGVDDVKVHNDKEAHELTHALHTKALANEKDIYFAKDNYRPGTENGAKMIGHELTHIAEGHTRGKIAFWGGSDHEKLTQEAATQVMPQEGSFINSLKFYSNMMDLRLRRFIQNWKVIPYGVASKFMTYTRKGVGKIPGLGNLARKIPVPGVAPEGPEHGEGGMYETGIGAARSINVNAQKKYVDRAVELKRGYNQVLKNSKEPLQSKLGKLAKINKQIVKELGDVLHIAQDRGSHWEGAKGMGHDDQRPIEEYECDDPGKNGEGYKNALNNSLEVLKDFWSKKDQE